MSASLLLQTSVKYFCKVAGSKAVALSLIFIILLFLTSSEFSEYKRKGLLVMGFTLLLGGITSLS